MLFLPACGMVNGNHPQRARLCGAPKRICWHVASVATLILIVLFLQDSLLGIPWPGKRPLAVLKSRNLRSWWQVQHSENIGSVSSAVAKGRESLQGNSLERTYVLADQTRANEQVEGTDSLQSAEQQGPLAWLLASKSAQAEAPKPLRTLRFKVCNAYADQRLALVFGILLANVTGRIPVLPPFLLNGEQFRNDDVTSTAADNTVSMEEVYDVDGFVEGVFRGAGVRIFLPTEAPDISKYTPFSVVGDWRDWLENLVRVEAPHVALGCTFLKLGKDAVREREGLAWAVLDSLRLNERFARIRDAAVARLGGLRAGSRVKQSNPAAAGFNFLHLRIENDWLAHCERWEALQDGVPRVNCLNNTWNVHEALRIKGIDPGVPLYVAAHWESVDPERGERVLSLMKEAGYEVVKKEDLFDRIDVEGLSREQGAVLDFYLAREADKFIGNSVSVFTALLLAERWHASKWASYYNGQNVPLSSVFPLYRRKGVLCRPSSVLPVLKQAVVW